MADGITACDVPKTLQHRAAPRTERLQNHMRTPLIPVFTNEDSTLLLDKWMNAGGLEPTSLRNQIFLNIGLSDFLSH